MCEFKVWRAKQSDDLMGLRARGLNTISFGLIDILFGEIFLCQLLLYLEMN